MSFQIMCPHCQKIITENDFQANEQSLSHLQQFFNSKEAIYKNTIKESLKEEFDSIKKIEMKAELNKQEVEINKEKQKIIDELNSKIQNLTTKQETNDFQLKEKLSEKELEINKEKQKIIDELNSKIQNLTTKQETNDSQLKEKLSEKELEINKEKQKIIDELNKKINDLESNKKISQETLKTQLSEKELEINKEKQKIIDELNKKINYLENSNSKLRLIPPKVMGENFEKEFKSKLKEVFLTDNINKITSGNKRADFEQIVYENENEIGKIIFEVKAGNIWDEKWINKFEKDINSRQAKYGILVAASFRDKYIDVPFEKISGKNIFVTDYISFSFVAHIIRILIIKEFNIIKTSENVELQQKLEKLRNWKDQDLKSIISEGTNFISKIISETDKLESIKNSILENANNIEKNIINKLKSEIFINILNTI